MLSECTYFWTFLSDSHSFPTRLTGMGWSKSSKKKRWFLTTAYLLSIMGCFRRKRSPKVMLHWKSCSKKFTVTATMKQGVSWKSFSWNYVYVGAPWWRAIKPPVELSSVPIGLRFLKCSVYLILKCSAGALTFLLLQVEKTDYEKTREAPPGQEFVDRSIYN